MLEKQKTRLRRLNNSTLHSFDMTLLILNSLVGAQGT